MNVWWCNQKTCWRWERPAGVVCSSAETEAPKYRETVGKVKVGDIIVHYVKKYIVALSRAREDGQYRSYLENLGDCEYIRGWIVQTEYHDLATPIPRDAVNKEILKLGLSDCPIQRDGRVRQAYFLPFDVEGLRIVRTASQEDWPDWAESALGRPR